MGNLLKKSSASSHDGHDLGKTHGLQLGPLAKNLFMRHCLSSDCKRSWKDKSKFLKFPTISRNFLKASQHYKIYSLVLRSNSNYDINKPRESEEGVEAFLEVFVQSFDAKNSVTSRRLPLESKWTSKEESWDWKRMKKLIHLLQPPNLYVDYYLLNDPITLKKCEKLMKTTKGHLSLNFKTGIGPEPTHKLLKEFSDKIYQLNCKAVILAGTTSRLHLDYCFVKEIKSFDQLCAVLCNHTVKRLELELDDEKYASHSLTSTDLADFPTFGDTTELIIYRKILKLNSKQLSQTLKPIIKLFPNLQLLTFRIDTYQLYHTTEKISSRKSIESFFKFYDIVQELRDVCVPTVKIALMFESNRVFKNPGSMHKLDSKDNLIKYENRKDPNFEWLYSLKQHEKFSPSNVKQTRISIVVVWNSNTKV